MDAALGGALQAQEKSIAARLEAIVAGMRGEERRRWGSDRRHDPDSDETWLALQQRHHNNNTAAERARSAPTAAEAR